jgi:signal transduction histidine kinase
MQITAGAGSDRPLSTWRPACSRGRDGDRRAHPVAELPSDPDCVLFDAAEAVGRSLGLTYVGIELGAQRYEWGRDPGETTVIGLAYGDRSVGRLRVAGRAGGPLTPREYHALAAQARQVALTAHSVGLSKRAIRCQEQIVAAREEERRHLRRDLHDGLGPSLAALTLTLDAARNLLDRDPPAVEGLLTGMREQSQHAIADIRRLVSGLRPPTLDQLGLLGAIRDCVEQHTGRGDLRVRVEAPDQLPPLPAAVEVAALRIVQEAMSNVVQHARARHCTVRLAVGDTLEVEVEDDGAGPAPGAQPGTGVPAMRERAREVGGACELVVNGGMRVSARLPLALAG